MPDTALLRHGKTCWRSGTADEASFHVDAESYFGSLYRNLPKAQRAIYILGWDIDSRQPLAPESDPERSRFAAFLDRLVRERPELHVYVLCWNFSPIYMMSREAFLALKMGVGTHERIHFKYDDQHPMSASHHQKVVVIDDAYAYCGGLDLTTARWDSDAHAACDPRRVKGDGQRYAPFHDVQVAVRGDPAAWLGELCRERWARATGERLVAPRGGAESAVFEAGSHAIARPHVGIARTVPAFKHGREVREVERLFVEMIDAARKTIYIENQYFTSEIVTKALCRALKRRDGPEIFLVIPKQQDNWLSQHTMGTLSSKFLADLRAADSEKRFSVCYPEDKDLVGGHYVNVHAKVMIVDGEYARVGSANLNNRSMGLDTECDVVIDARGDAAVRAKIDDFFGHLLGHHVGAGVAETLAVVRARGSIREAVGVLNRRGGKTLEPFVAPEQAALGTVDKVMLDIDVIDLAKPLGVERFIDEVVFRSGAARELALPTRVPQGLLLTLFFCVVLAVVRLMPGMNPESALAATPWPWYLLAFTAGSLLFVPLNVLIVISACVLPPWEALAVSLAGALAGAMLAYGGGALMGRKTRWIADVLRRPTLFFRHAAVAHDVVGVFFSRLFPIAPYAAVNLAAGRERLGFGSFILGTALGVVPGSVAIVSFHRALVSVAQRPGPGTAVQFALLLAAIVGIFYVIDRRLGGAARLGMVTA